MNFIKSNNIPFCIENTPIPLGGVNSYQPYTISGNIYVIRLFSNGGLGIPESPFHRTIFEISFSSIEKTERFIKKFLENIKRVDHIDNTPYANCKWTIRNAFNTPHIYRIDSSTGNIQIKIGMSKEYLSRFITAEFQDIDQRPLDFYIDLLNRFPRLVKTHAEMAQFIKLIPPNQKPYPAALEVLANMARQILILPEEKSEYTALTQLYPTAEPMSTAFSQKSLQKELSLLKDVPQMPIIQEDLTISEEILETQTAPGKSKLDSNERKERAPSKEQSTEIFQDPFSPPSPQHKKKDRSPTLADVIKAKLSALHDSLYSKR